VWPFQVIDLYSVGHVDGAAVARVELDLDQVERLERRLAPLGEDGCGCAAAAH
jgi:hypothetical protein